MPPENLFQTIGRSGVVPVVSLDSAESALPLADALLEGGLPLVEVTFRTAAAAEAIARICLHRPEMLVGAGTVLTAANCQAAADAGAMFAVAPGLNPEVVVRAQRAGLPFVPGVCTPSEIEHAVALDCKILKFFPAQALGGMATIRAIAGPYQHLGLRLIPTGGINLTNLESYLAAGVVLAVGGTWLARREELAEGRWDLVRDRCRQAVEIVAKLREVQAAAAKL